MVKIWHLGADVNNFDNLTLINEKWSIMRFDGTKRANTWIPVSVQIIEETKKSDTPGLSSGVPVLSLRAIKILEDILRDSVEILPLKCKNEEYYAINVIDVLDCIDYEKSKFEKFESSGRIMLFNKYAFNPECVKGKHIFKIIDEPVRRPFVSDEFRNRVLESELVGFKFDLVWDSECN